MKKVLVLTAVLGITFAAQANVGLEKSIKEIIKLNPSKIENHSKKLSKYLMKNINKKKWQIYHNEKNINKSFHIIALKPNQSKLNRLKFLKYLRKIILFVA